MLTNTESDAYTDVSSWPEIVDYALIGDCRTAALVGRDGGIDWLCLPDFSGPAFFARILDRARAGRFVVGPGRPVASERGCVGASNVLQTTFHIGDGELRLTDAMTIPPALEPQLLPQRELRRCIEAVGADVPVEVVYEPKLDYGRSDVRLAQCVLLLLGRFPISSVRDRVSSCQRRLASNREAPRRIEGAYWTPAFAGVTTIQSVRFLL